MAPRPRRTPSPPGRPATDPLNLWRNGREGREMAVRAQPSSSAPPLEGGPGAPSAAWGRGERAAVDPSRDAVRLDDVTHGYRGRRGERTVALAGCSLTVAARETVAVVG